MSNRSYNSADLMVIPELATFQFPVGMSNRSYTKEVLMPDEKRNPMSFQFPVGMSNRSYCLYDPVDCV